MSNLESSLKRQLANIDQQLNFLANDHMRLRRQYQMAHDSLSYFAAKRQMQSVESQLEELRRQKGILTKKLDKCHEAE